MNLEKFYIFLKYRNREKLTREPRHMHPQCSDRTYIKVGGSYLYVAKFIFEIPAPTTLPGFIS